MLFLFLGLYFWKYWTNNWRSVDTNTCAHLPLPDHISIGHNFQKLSLNCGNETQICFYHSTFSYRSWSCHSSVKAIENKISFLHLAIYRHFCLWNCLLKHLDPSSINSDKITSPWWWNRTSQCLSPHQSINHSKLSTQENTLIETKKFTWMVRAPGCNTELRRGASKGVHSTPNWACGTQKNLCIWERH